MNENNIIAAILTRSTIGQNPADPETTVNAYYVIRERLSNETQVPKALESLVENARERAKGHRG